MEGFVGIDVSKKSLDAAFLSGTSGRMATRKFLNSVQGFRELLGWCLEKAEASQIHFCMESTGTYGLGLARFLSEAGLCVSCENPRVIQHFAIGARIQNKTDRSDSRAIARYAQMMKPKLWDPDPEVYDTMTMLLRRADDLEKLALQERNRLESDAVSGAIKDSIKRMVQVLEEERFRVLTDIEDLIAADAGMQAMVVALVAEPGVGELTAIRILSHLRWNYKTYQSAQQASAAAGLNPVKKESGTWKGRTKISKQGPSSVRGNLHMSALAGVKHNAVLGAFYERLISRGLPKLAAITACCRKLIMLCYGILKRHQQGIPPTYSGTKQRYTTLFGKQRKFIPLTS